MSELYSEIDRPLAGTLPRKNAPVLRDARITSVDEEKLTMSITYLDDATVGRSTVDIRFPYVSDRWGIMVLPEVEDVVGIGYRGDEHINFPVALTYRPRMSRERRLRFLKKITVGEIFIRSKAEAHLFFDKKGRVILSSSPDRDVTLVDADKQAQEAIQESIDELKAQLKGENVTEADKRAIAEQIKILQEEKASFEEKEKINERTPDCFMIVGTNSGKFDPYFTGEEVTNSKLADAYQFYVQTASGGIISIDKFGNVFTGGSSAKSNVTASDEFHTIGSSRVANVGGAEFVGVEEDLNMDVGNSLLLPRNLPKSPDQTKQRGSFRQRILKTCEQAIGGVRTLVVGQTDLLDPEVKTDQGPTVDPPTSAGSEKILIQKVSTQAIGKGVKINVGSTQSDAIEGLVNSAENFYKIKFSGKYVFQVGDGTDDNSGNMIKMSNGQFAIKGGGSGQFELLKIIEDLLQQLINARYKGFGAPADPGSLAKYSELKRQITAMRLQS